MELFLFCLAGLVLPGVVDRITGYGYADWYG